MKATLRKIALVVCMLVVLAFALSVDVPRAEAILGVCTYYSDATFTTVVGARGTGCCGEVVNWGIITPYRKCQNIYCLDVICPQTS
jgi:hypothetical protein